MRLLILSFYYPPDLCAGSFRCEALVDAIRTIRPDNLQVDVITTTPNRYQSLNVTAPEFEQSDWLTVRRIPVPTHQSGMSDQSKSFLAYARGALAAIKGKKYDAVFATSSRLMTAVLGANISGRLDVPLYLDIRDLFIDTMGDVLGSSPLRVLLPGFGMLERRTFAQAARINMVSPGFADYLSTVAPKAGLRTFTNGVDADFLGRSYTKTMHSDIPEILYAGNIGEGQGLHKIIPKAAAALNGTARFRIIGDGGRLAELRASVSTTENVQLSPPVPRAQLTQSYCDADMLFIHLNDHKAFHKVLPSKIFEYAATGKPILAGVAGVSARFLNDEVPGSFVFAPCDDKAMVDAVLAARKVEVPIDRTAFLAKYARASIMNEMARDLISFAKRSLK